MGVERFNASYVRLYLHFTCGGGGDFLLYGPPFDHMTVSYILAGARRVGRADYHLPRCTSHSLSAFAAFVWASAVLIHAYCALSVIVMRSPYRLPGDGRGWGATHVQWWWRAIYTSYDTYICVYIHVRKKNPRGICNFNQLSLSIAVRDTY